MSLTDAILQEIIAAADGLHKSGTFNPRPLAALANYLSKRRILCSAETGSGASTLLFSHLSARHIVFSIDGGGGSVVNVRNSALLSPGRVLWVEGPTQLTLPSYRFEEKLQAALIDGPHAYPFPDLEYYYLYQHLGTGALLVIDDIQIPSIRNLYDFLRREAMFELEETVENTAFFVRTDTPTFSPTGDSWWEQRYNQSARLDETARLMEEVERLQKALQRQGAALFEKEKELVTAQANLQGIYRSHGWKALSVYYRLRDSLLSAMGLKRSD
jgi:hypothetical protein